MSRLVGSASAAKTRESWSAGTDDLLVNWMVEDNVRNHLPLVNRTVEKADVFLPASGR
jgi:hypothetical protein